ncbi:hypothetical protein [Streptomyces sp. NPDC004324]
MANPLDNTLVTYNGSLGTITPLLAVECRCRSCIAATGAPGPTLLVLIDPLDGEPVLLHPRRESLSPVRESA